MAKKFSEVKENNVAYPEATFYDTDEKKAIMNKEIEFLEFKVVKSQTGEFAIVLAKDGNKAISFSIGGVVFQQLKDNEAKLPFVAKIVEQKAKKSGRLFMTLE